MFSLQYSALNCERLPFIPWEPPTAPRSTTPDWLILGDSKVVALDWLIYLAAFQPLDDTE